MFWLSRPYSESEIRKYLAFSGLEVTVDQNGRLVIYVIDDDSGVDAGEMLKRVQLQHPFYATFIPCDELTETFVHNKLRTVCR